MIAPEGVGWRVDLRGVEIPDNIAWGKINRHEFRCEKAILKHNILHLRQGKDFFADLELIIFFFPKANESLEDRTFEFSRDSQFGNPHVHMKWKEKGENLPKTRMFMGDYTMRIEFGAASGGILPGKIYICLPDEKKSFVAGRFEAEIE